MNSVWLSLLWKEWCEFRWKLVALTVSFVVGQAIFASILVNDPWQYVATAIAQSTQVCLVVYAVLAGSFVGMSVSAGENSNRTMRFTQALPVPLWQVAIVRFLVGLFTVVVPILCVMLFLWAFITYVWGDQLRNVNDFFQHAWITSNFFSDRTLSATLGVSSLLLWVSACGVNRSDEVRAGAIAFLACTVLWGAWIAAMAKIQDVELRTILEATTVGLPGGPAFGGEFSFTDFPRNYPLLGIVAITSHLLLLAWFVICYGKSTGKAYTGGKQFISDWFRFRGPAKPFRSQSMAIIWKQVRELGPLALMAAAGVLAVMTFAYFTEKSMRADRDWGELLAGLSLVVGGFVTLVSGIGMIYEDYSRGLPNFWRSRPINLHQWFFLKYFAGILVLAVAFVPLFLVAAKLNDWKLAPRDMVTIYALVFLGMYSGSLATYALVRQPIYAVILTIASPYAAMIPLFLIFPDGPPQWLNNFAGAFISISVIIVLVTVLAWQAVVRDWGLKRHR
jgi:hypothetical protein